MPSAPDQHLQRQPQLTLASPYTLPQDNASYPHLWATLPLPTTISFLLSYSPQASPHLSCRPHPSPLTLTLATLPSPLHAHSTHTLLGPLPTHWLDWMGLWDEPGLKNRRGLQNGINSELIRGEFLCWGEMFLILRITLCLLAYTFMQGYYRKGNYEVCYIHENSSA